MLYVWNPSIKRFKMLPTPNLITRTSAIKLGFGYDSVCDDYKVVRILVSSDSNVVEAELYSANEDRWRDVEVPIGLNNAWPLWSYIPVHAINEVLYFGASEVLVSFDLHNELFKVYSYPYSVKDIRNFTSFVYEGAVAMIFMTVVGDGMVSSLWTLDDVGGKVCWTKKFVVEPELKIDRVDLYLGSERFLAVNFCDFQYFVYDLAKKETERLLLSLVEHNVSSVVKYTESLVSLAGFEQVEKVKGDMHDTVNYITVTAYDWFQKQIIAIKIISVQKTGNIFTQEEDDDDSEGEEEEEEYDDDEEAAEHFGVGKFQPPDRHNRLLLLTSASQSCRKRGTIKLYQFDCCCWFYKQTWKGKLLLELILGVGSVLGAGVLVLTGQAARDYVGPAVIILYLISELGDFIAFLAAAGNILFEFIVAGASVHAHGLHSLQHCVADQLQQQTFALQTGTKIPTTVAAATLPELTLTWLSPHL
ncbi:hypothetical protein ACET3Z_013952 [Daucus carota]